MSRYTLKYLRVFFCMAALLFSLQSRGVTENQFRVHGLSSFNEQDAAKLETWLTKGVNATRATLGVYPTPLELYVYPKKSNQPVPWAHTQRDKIGSVHLYVDPRFTLQKFIDDWTIYHELAHMALPYLGVEYGWFSEGFASYMQYQIMVEAESLKGSLTENYQTKISPQLRWFNKSKHTAASIAQRLMAKEQYPAAYWGSAYFFVIADRQLFKKHKIHLIDLVRHYQDCCRAEAHSIDDLLSSLDGMLNDTLFSQLMKQFKTVPASELYPENFGKE